jgi:hypothetical protein
MIGLDLLQLAQQLVVLRIGNDRRVEHVVSIVVLVQLTPKRFRAMAKFVVFGHDGTKAI